MIWHKPVHNKNHSKMHHKKMDTINTKSSIQSRSSFQSYIERTCKQSQDAENEALCNLQMEIRNSLQEK